jgi:sugar phosphate isomerase/epimerase
MNVAMYTDFFKTLKSDGIVKAADLAKKAGFDSVEMLETRALELIPDEKSARQTREILSDRGIEMSCYSFAVDMIPFDKYGNIVGDTAEAEKVTIEAARIASKLGSPYFHHTLVTNLRPDLHLPKPPYNEVLETLVGAASRIARACNDMGITVLYEPQGFYVNGSKNFGKFYNEMKRLGYNVGVCGDMANTLFVDERPVEFYKNFASEIRHVHVKDYECLGRKYDFERKCLLSLGGTVYSETELGSGAVDFKSCMRILKDADYRGAFSFEINHQNEDIVESCRNQIDVLKRNF